MNDRFRFRAWNKEEKQMYYDAQNTYDYMTGKPIIFAESFSCLLTNDEEWEVEQCTGLKDKNGNLIYESDYVKDKDGDIYLVKWDDELVLFTATGKDNCGFETIMPFMKGETEEVEIIGNIHEQAEQKD